MANSRPGASGLSDATTFRRCRNRSGCPRWLTRLEIGDEIGQRVDGGDGGPGEVGDAPGRRREELAPVVDVAVPVGREPSM